MNKSTKLKLILDILMAATFVLLFNKMVLGGLPFHEIAGLAISVAFLTHILLNIQWVIKVSAKLFDRKLPGMTRFGYLLNLLLLLSMTFIVVSGIFISKIVFPNMQIGNTPWFKISHITISYLTLVLVGVHAGLHWKWVMNAVKKIGNFKTSKAAPALIAKLLAAFILVYGCYQMYSTDFAARIQGLGNVFNITQQGTPPAGFKQRPGESNANNGSFEQHSHHPDGDMDGGPDGGDFQSPNALGVIATYFNIMGVFIILTYYLDKIIFRKKRRPAEAG